VLLMPRPDATVKPSLALDPELRDRVAELQSILVGKPDDADAALELANIYLDGHRPDWALATIGPALAAHAGDYRLHHVRAIAYADRFEAEPAFEAAKKAEALCAGPPPVGASAPSRPATSPLASPGLAPCGPAVQARLALLRSALDSVVGVDMKNQPYLAKDRIFKELHPVYLPKPRPKAAPKPPSTHLGPAPEKP
jgi:hypothetical protein